VLDNNVVFQHSDLRAVGTFANHHDTVYAFPAR
jgi:hypothetical protein